MAFEDTPTVWLPNYTTPTAGEVTLDHADFPELTDAECHEVTGDIRKIYFGILEGIYESWSNMDVADRPNRMSLSKNVSTNVDTGIQTNTFTYRFETSITGQDVADEE